MIRILPALAIAFGDPALDRLVSMHESGLAAITSFKVVYRETTQPAPDSTVFPAVRRRTWIKQGSSERVQDALLNAPQWGDGLPRGKFQDLTFDDVRYEKLSNWDPENPQRLTPAKQGTVSAETGIRTNDEPPGGVVDPAPRLLLSFGAKPRRTLRDYLAAAAESKYSGGGTVSGSRTEVIAGRTKDDIQFEIHLDPACGHLIRKFHASKAASLKRADGTTTLGYGTTEVIRFEEVKPGVFFPFELVNFAFGGNLKVSVVVEAIVVNEQFPPETFRLRFPEDCLVRRFPPVNGVLRVDLWGRDGPKHTFDTPEQFQQYIAPLLEKPEETGWGASRALAIGLPILAVAALAAIVLRRRWRRA